MSDPNLVWGTPAATNTFIAFTAVAVWSSVPLTLRLFVTLKNRRTLYFNAILICSWGLCVRGVGYMLQYFPTPTPWLAAVIISQFGWVLMVSGFAIVLWSRLNLIGAGFRTRRYLLWVIMFNGFVFHITMTVFAIVTNAQRKDPRLKAALNRWVPVKDVFERIQILAFCGQEIAISSLYLVAALRYLQSSASFFVKKRKLKSQMALLLVVQAIVVIIDIALITIDFMGYLRLKGFMHSFVYCVKLELEFVVLTQLFDMAQLGLTRRPFSLGSGPSDEENGLGKPETDSTQSARDSSVPFVEPTKVVVIDRIEPVLDGKLTP